MGIAVTNSLALDTRRAGEDSIAIRRDGATPYQKLNYSTVKQKKALTPVIPIIFYHGKKTWHEKPFSDYFPESDDVLHEFMPHFDYLLLDTAKHSGSEFQALSDVELQMGLMMMKHIANPNSLLNQLNNIFFNMEKLLETEQGNHYFETIVMYLVHNTDLTTETLVEKMSA